MDKIAVVVDYDKKGNAIFRSINGIGTSEDERNRALKLDKLVKKDLNKLKNKLDLRNDKTKYKVKNKLQVYWEFGKVIRKIFYKSGLISNNEKHFFWGNVKLHAPKNLLAQDRGPNRIHVEYCFRLAGYSKNIAMKREWSEWVYLFDSPFINSEHRFDEWDDRKISKEKGKIDRDTTRLFVQNLNNILKDIETNDLSDEELIRCYNASWKLTLKIKNNDKISKNKEFKKYLKIIFAENQNLIGKLISGVVNDKEFADRIVELLANHQ